VTLKGGGLTCLEGQHSGLRIKFKCMSESHEWFEGLQTRAGLVCRPLDPNPKPLGPNTFLSFFSLLSAFVQLFGLKAIISKVVPTFAFLL
jgi:hypothetical protein